MASTQCSECDEEIEIAGRARLGQKIVCGHCGAQLEVVVTEPLEVDLAQEEDDLWEEELDDEDLDDLEDEEDETDDLDDFEELDDLELEDDFEDDDFEDDADDFEDDEVDEGNSERWR